MRCCHPRQNDKTYRKNSMPILMIGLAFLVFFGCTPYSKRMANLRNSYHKGDLESANAEAERLLEKHKRNRSLIQMDQALVQLAEGNPRKTESLLREVRDEFTSQPQRKAVGEAAAFVLDDQARSFTPDDYEQLFVLMYLALANLVQDGDDAYAYANQISTLQSKIETRIQNSIAAHRRHAKSVSQQTEEKQSENQQTGSDTEKDNPDDGEATVQFKQIALAPLIAAILHEQTHRDYDTAEYYYQKTLDYHPSLREAIHGLERAKHGHHSQKGNGVLYVFAAVGKGPYKIEKAEVPTSQAMLIADQILSAIGDHTLPPTLAPIKTARIVVPRNLVQNIRVLVNGNTAGETETVTDLGLVAREQDRAKQDIEIARAVVRRIIKKSAIYAGKNSMETESHSWIDLLINLGGVAWEAAESADTRSWSLLPEKIQLLRVELPVGTHQIELVPISIGIGANESFAATATIRDGRNTYMFAQFPTAKLTGKVLVSGNQTK